jgi:signal transduction histidine kinase
LFAAYAGAYLYYQKGEQAALDVALAQAQSNESVRLEESIARASNRLQDFVASYSLSNEAADVAADLPSTLWAPHVSGVLTIYDIDYLWVFDPDMRPRACVTSAKTDALSSSDPFFSADMREARLGNPFGHFFIRQGGSLWEVAYAPIQPPDDNARTSAPKGYMAAVRHWNDDFLSRLSCAMGAEFSLLPPSQASSSQLGKVGLSDAAFSARHQFIGRSGDILLVLNETRRLPFLAEISRRIENGYLWTVAGVAGLFVLTVIAGFLAIGNPVRKLTKALRTGDLSILEKARTRTGSYGVLAEAVAYAYEQRSSMQSETLGRGKVEEKLVQRERFLSTILRYINGIVLVVSKEGVLNLAEGRELDAYGLLKERDEGRPITSILRGQDRLAQFEAALRGKRSSMEQKVGERIFLTMCEPLPAPQGGTESIVVLALDVTEKRQVEETLMRAKQEAERADRIKTQFLSIMSHETRTPLNGVLGFASVLRETPLNEEQISYLDRIAESGQNLLRLLTDILDLARLEAGEGKKNIEPLSLTALVYQFAERFRIACQQKGRIDFDLDVDQRLPEYIESDNEMLSRILASILDNAVKFTDIGRVKFGVAWIMRDRDGRSGVQFTVSDTGPGISPEIARNLFNPFSQGDSSKTRKHGGLGLGLTIAHRLAILLEGRLTFETKVDVGTTFTFFLPTKALDEAAVRSAENQQTV